MKQEGLVRRRSLVADQSGATLVEYGIMLGCIAAVSIPIIVALGATVQGFFATINAGI